MSEVKRVTVVMKDGREWDVHSTGINFYSDNASGGKMLEVLVTIPDQSGQIPAIMFGHRRNDIYPVFNDCSSGYFNLSRSGWKNLKEAIELAFEAEEKIIERA